MLLISRAFRAYREAFSGLPREVWLLSAINLVNRAGTMVLPFLTLYLTQSLGFTVAQAGQLLSLYGFGSIFGAYLGGWSSDRFGAQKVQVVSFIATGAGFLILAQLRSFASLACAIVVISTVAEAFRPALFSAVSQHSPPEVRTRAFVLLRLATNLGMAIGPAVGGVLALHHYGWLFYADAATCWCAALFLLATIGWRSPPVESKPDENNSDAKAPSSPWTDLPFLAFLGLSVILGIAFFQLWSTFPLHLKEVSSFTEAEIGLLFALNPVLIVIFEMVLVQAVEHLNHLRMIGFGSFLVCAGMAIVVFGPAAWIAVLAMVVLTIGEMLALPLCNAAVAHRAASGSTGRYMGAYTVSVGIAFVLGPAIGTAVYQNLGPTALWSGILCLGMVLLVGNLSLAPHFERETP